MRKKVIFKFFKNIFSLKCRKVKLVDSNGSHKTISIDTNKMVEMGYLTKRQVLSLFLFQTKIQRGSRLLEILGEVDQKLENTKPKKEENPEAWVSRIVKDFKIQPSTIKPLQVLPIKVQPGQINFISLYSSI